MSSSPLQEQAFAVFLHAQGKALAAADALANAPASADLVRLRDAADRAAARCDSAERVYLASRPATTKKQKAYKMLSVASSCRKYLDAIAAKLAFFYDFDTSHTAPTIGDVLRAREGRSWGFRLLSIRVTVWDDEVYERTIAKGSPLIQTPLPNLFTDDEWKTIREFNFDINEKNHNARIPEDSRGNPYIVIPHAKFTPEQVKFLQLIGYKAQIFSRPDILQVKDEDAESMDSVF